MLADRVTRSAIARALLVAGLLLFAVYHHWQVPSPSVKGYEYEWIAASLATGHGFSFPPTTRWLYTRDDPGYEHYGVTAWKEPIYPYTIALALRSFGDDAGRQVIVGLQICLLFGVCLLVYALAARLFSPVAGFVGGVATAAIPALHVQAGTLLQPVIASAFLVLVALWLVLGYRDHPTHARALALGGFLGVSALVHVVVASLVGVAIVVMLLRPSRNRAHLLLLVAAFAASVAPWTIRNYVQFGYLIPVQTGFGQFANVANGYLLETYRTAFHACDDGSPPVFQSAGPVDAVYRLVADFPPPAYRAIHCEQDRFGREAYYRLNEHERDHLHRVALTTFVREHPVDFVKLTLAKAFVYLYRGRWSLPTLLGLIGMLVYWRERHGWLFFAAVVGYTAVRNRRSPL